MPPALGAQSLSHWTTREIPFFCCCCFWWLVFSSTLTAGASLKLQGYYGTVWIIRKFFPWWFQICLLTILPTESVRGCWNLGKMNLLCAHVIPSGVCRQPHVCSKPPILAAAGMPRPVAKGGWETAVIGVGWGAHRDSALDLSSCWAAESGFNRCWNHASSVIRNKDLG